MLATPRPASRLHRPLSVLLSSAVPARWSSPSGGIIQARRAKTGPAQESEAKPNPKPQPQPLAIGSVLHSQQGRAYTIEAVLQERREPVLACVYRASADGQRFAIKNNIIQDNFAYQQDLQKRVAASPHVRTIVDAVPDGEFFVYPFRDTDALQLLYMAVSHAAKKAVLRCALTGLADIHDQGIFHTDIKPDNIMFDLRDETTPTHVQIIDLESGMVLPPGKSVLGPLCGNALWRSPEAWARARQNQASDVYSFGLVVLYVLHRQWPPAGSREALLSDGADAWQPILRSHLAHFSTEAGYQGLLEHIGADNAFFPRLVALARDVGPSRLSVDDAALRDLLGQMLVLDPKQRITAREALAHPWWEE